MKLAALLSMPFVLLFLMLGSMSYLVVDVKESGPDGVHLMIPVPLLAAQVALAFVPQERTRVQLPHEAREYLPLAEKAVAELAKAPDGELVRVEERGEKVLITKSGDMLLVAVHDGDNDVSVKVPLSLATDILGRCRGEINAADIVAGLRRAGRVDLVDVRGRDEHVKVSIW